MERQQIDIGGVALDAALTGRGNVTVIFENGLGTSLEEWDGVVEPIAARARTLRYDRRRAPATGPVRTQSAADLAGDLEKLLAMLNLGPPYVLVGHTLLTARGEGAGIRVSLAALRRECPDLPPVFVNVLTGGDPEGAAAKSARRVHEAWEAMAARAANARLTKVPTSGHHMPLDAPDVVTRAIVDVLDALDGGRPPSA